MVAQGAAAGLLLAGAALLGMLLSNSPWSAGWEALLHSRWGVSLGPLHLTESNLDWVNDALMALFFLQVGVEIKREWLFGALAETRARVLPLAAALGGMALPALVYAGVNLAHPEFLAGWAVPAATDIAFALGLMALFARGLPARARVFLTAVAVLDDLGAVMIIAAFYTAQLSGPMLGMAVATVIAMGLLANFGLRRAWPYLALGLLLWWWVLHSGVHPTVAGVLTGVLLPQQRDGGAGQRVERALAPVVTWGVLPLFALANAGIELHGSLGELLRSPVTWGVALGLLLGKPMGILGGVFAAAHAGGGLPPGYSWRLMLALAGFCGVGFTMSLFIADLAWPDGAAAFDAARMGVLLGTLLAVGAGSAVAARLYPRHSARRHAVH